MDRGGLANEHVRVIVSGHEASANHSMVSQEKTPDRANNQIHSMMEREACDIPPLNS